MASPLTKTIMNNISKKALGQNIDSSKNISNCINNINKNEELLLKDIINKSSTKINLNSLSKSKLNIESKQTCKSDLTRNTKVKQNKNIISLKDLAK